MKNKEPGRGRAWRGAGTALPFRASHAWGEDPFSSWMPSRARGSRNSSRNTPGAKGIHSAFPVSLQKGISRGGESRQTGLDTPSPIFSPRLPRKRGNSAHSSFPRYQRVMFRCPRDPPSIPGRCPMLPAERGALSPPG